LNSFDSNANKQVKSVIQIVESTKANTDGTKVIQEITKINQDLKSIKNKAKFAGFHAESR
jgi:hypothetical protein